MSSCLTRWQYCEMWSHLCPLVLNHAIEMPHIRSDLCKRTAQGYVLKAYEDLLGRLTLEVKVLQEPHWDHEWITGIDLNVPHHALAIR